MAKILSVEVDDSGKVTYTLARLAARQLQNARDVLAAVQKVIPGDATGNGVTVTIAGLDAIMAVLGEDEDEELAQPTAEQVASSRANAAAAMVPANPAAEEDDELTLPTAAEALAEAYKAGTLADGNGDTIPELPEPQERALSDEREPEAATPTARRRRLHGVAAHTTGFDGGGE
jgi:hypothetical protein